MSGEIQSYRDLTAWQKGMDLAEQVYAATRAWPKDELYGLTSQVRRSAASVPSNIAEGKGRFGSAEFLHHLSIARGSLHEMETAEACGVEALRRCARGSSTPQRLAPQRLRSLSDEAGRLVAGLIRSLRR